MTMTGGSLENTKDRGKVGGSFEDTKVSVRDLSEHLSEPVACVLCGKMTRHVIRGVRGFVACAGECRGPASA
jgi:hypothetical protein